MGAKNEREAFCASWGRQFAPPPIRVVTEKDLLKEEIACLRLLKAIAEQERDDAQADAAAYRAERDAVNAANRRLRLKANEDDTFLRAARHIGKETEKELAELRALIEAMRGWENASTDTEIELRSRIDVYQCEVEGLKAELVELADLRSLIRGRVSA